METTTGSSWVSRGRTFTGWVLATTLLVTASLAQEEDGNALELASLVAELSEEGAYFDTDNLVSNETSFAHAASSLEPVGGVYIGVGPEQNFHYIARTAPEWAFIVDIRRDNLLHVLLLLGVLVEAEDPAEYLQLLFAREAGNLRAGDFPLFVQGLSGGRADKQRFEAGSVAAVAAIRDDLAFELSEADEARIKELHREYFLAGLELRFTSHGRRGFGRYPSYGDLLLAKDDSGQRQHFLASQEAYDVVRGLAIEGRIVPLVGDFAGERTLRKLAAILKQRNLAVTTFYTSNVEFYLVRNGRFDEWVENARALPFAANGIFLRAYFDYGRNHPQSLPGHRSTLVRQRANDFFELWDEGSLGSYFDVTTKKVLP